MNNNLVVAKSILVNANKTKVWEALTNPTLIKEYLYGTNTVTDWKVGSEIIFQGEYSGQTYRDHGVILENVFLEKISYSYWSGFSGTEDKPENYSTVSYSLVDKGNDQTEFTWTQKGFATEDGYNHSKNGMEEFLLGVKKVMEK